jgi:hypothetical protein
MVMTLLLACLEGAPAELPEATVPPPPVRARTVEAPGLHGYLVRPGEDKVVTAEVWAHASIQEDARVAARDASERGHGILLIGEDTTAERALSYLGGLAWVESVSLLCDRAECADEAPLTKDNAP